MRALGSNSKLKYVDNHVEKKIHAKHTDTIEAAANVPKGKRTKLDAASTPQNAKKRKPAAEAASEASERKGDIPEAKKAKKAALEHKRKMREEARRLNAELEAIADDYSQGADLTVLYPTSQKIERTFEIHVGPTNSGKTYTALRELAAATTGTYLAPLRLLAIEVEEQLCSEGIACSLVTGEEQDIKENATHVSSTVEMADFSRVYDVAVIDEAQLIADRQRGGAWTAAIAGIAAYKVHVCTSPEALDLIISIINSLGSDYEVIEHERACPLVMEQNPFHYPDDVEPGDALITFSRKDVLHLAGELKRMGCAVSVIYGALPYAARREEVRKFADGETDVVVATDAIGMGLNLPIRRIVFMGVYKFDGVQRRKLKATELRQIAGRAGRYGKYDVGYVNSASDRAYVQKMLTGDVPAPGAAVLSFPASFLKLDLPISKMMDIWSRAKANTKFVKADVTDQVMLARTAELKRGGELSKEDIYRLSMVPFDVKNEDLLSTWAQIVGYHGMRHRVEEYVDAQVAGVSDNIDAMDLLSSEYAHKLVDLCYSYKRTFNMLTPLDVECYRAAKDSIAMHIIELLGEKATYSKHCKYCGEELPWNYPYGVCQECYELVYGWDRASSF